jgi:adenine-specific DNA-methyltransferase
MDEVFGEDNFVSQILYRRGGFQTSEALPNTFDFILWFSKNKSFLKFRAAFIQTPISEWFTNRNGSRTWPELQDVRYEEGDSIPKDFRLHSHRAAQSASSGESSIFPVILTEIHMFLLKDVGGLLTT